MDGNQARSITPITQDVLGGVVVLVLGAAGRGLVNLGATRLRRAPVRRLMRRRGRAAEGSAFLDGAKNRRTTADIRLARCRC